MQTRSFARSQKKNEQLRGIASTAHPVVLRRSRSASMAARKSALGNSGWLSSTRLKRSRTTSHLGCCTGSSASVSPRRPRIGKACISRAPPQQMLAADTGWTRELDPATVNCGCLTSPLTSVVGCGPRDATRGRNQHPHGLGTRLHCQCARAVALKRKIALEILSKL
jgi:hypothetical protein